MSSQTGGQIPSFCGVAGCPDGAGVFSQVGAPSQFCPPPCVVGNGPQVVSALAPVPTTLPSPWPLA